MAEFEFSVVRPSKLREVLFGGGWFINVSGDIPRNAAERFAKFMHTSGAPDRVEVYLDSSGGSVTGGIALGRELRSRWMNTHVGHVSEGSDGMIISRPGKCFSACTLAYLGGRFRWLRDDSHFGVHRFYFQNPSPDDADLALMLSAMIASYLGEMGVSARFMELSVQASGSEMLALSPKKLRDLKIVNDGFGETDWTMQSVQGSVYVRGERQTIYGHQKVLLACNTKSHALALYAVFEAMNRDDDLMTMGRIDIELNGSPWLDVSGRQSERAIENDYFNIVIPVSRSEARYISDAERVGVLLRFHGEAPIFFGVSGMHLEGGRHLLSGLLEICR